MRYWNRNLISATQREPSIGNTSGIYDLTSQLVFKKAVKWTSQIVTTDLTLNLNASDANSYPGSGTAWSDLTTNNLDFTLINGPTYDSSFGGYITFDGTNDHATLSSGWTGFGADPFTIEFWGRGHSSAVDESVVSTQGGGNGTFQFAFGNNSRLRMVAQDASGPQVLRDSTIALSGNTWKHVVAVREGTAANQFKFYENGSLDSTHTLSENLNSTYQLQIGRNRGATAYLDGDLSVLRIYKNKGLTALEVQQHFQSERGRFNI